MVKIGLLGQVLNLLAIDEEARLYSVIRLKLPCMEKIDLKRHHFEFLGIDEAILSYSEVIAEGDARCIIDHVYNTVVFDDTDHQKIQLRRILDGDLQYSAELHMELKNARNDEKSFWQRWWR